MIPTRAVRVMCVVGTRPEAIKMAPVVSRLRADSGRFLVHVLFTGQHRELLDTAARQLGLVCDSNLDVMQPDQSLSTLLARLLQGLDQALLEQKPDVVIAQGDTTTVLAAAMASHHRRIAFVHVEAGLRTADRNTPFPEEANRRLVSVLTDLHCAPTEAARRALLQENVRQERIIVTGNTVIDALRAALDRRLELPVPVAEHRNLVLMTMHRRESFGAGIEQVFEAVRTIAHHNPDVDIVYPVHPNPNVRTLAHARLGDVSNVQLIEPVEYHGFVALMARSCLILTDSGGVQEEAPTLGVPILVLRETTERPEGVEAGCAQLVGTDRKAIVHAANSALAAHRSGSTRAAPANPYGDGHAAERIVEAVWNLLEAQRNAVMTDRNAA